MPTVKRPIVLWLCAILLGGAAGLNWKRTSIPDNTQIGKALVRQGFKSESDANCMTRLGELSKIDSISDQDLKVMSEYVGAKDLPGAILISILRSAGNITVARQFAPLANKFWKMDPSRSFLREIPRGWIDKGIDPMSAGLVISEPDNKS